MTDFLLLATVFLVAGVFTVPIASRLGLGSVLGYLIAGIAISPVLTALGVDVIAIQHFAEFGVVMMLFLVGLELQPKSLWDMRAQLIGLGGGQVAITTVLVMAVAMALGQAWQISLAVGMVFALSSTAIVLQTLNEKGLMKSDGGQSSFSILLTQDIAVIPMLALLPLLAMPEVADLAGQVGDLSQNAGDGAGYDGGHDADHADGGHGHSDDGHGESLSLVDGLNGWQTALVNLAAIGVVLGIGTVLTGPLFRFVSQTNQRELFTAAALMLVISIALIMSLVGLSPALGTFIAGVVLANSPYRHELESDIDPFRGLLLGLFFMTVGAGVDFQLLAANAGTVFALTGGVILLKGLVLLALAYLFKLRGADKWLMAIGLAQAGEFGFVLLSFTVSNNIIPQGLSDLLLLVVALSMLVTPLLFIIYERLIVPRYLVSEAREADEFPETSNVIIVGAGRVGGLVDRILRAAGHSTTVIDYSSHRLEIMERFGVRNYFGDGRRPDLLHAAGIHDAAVLVVAIDEREGIDQIVHYAVSNFPNLKVVARAVDRDHVYDLWAMGCRQIIRETFDSSLRMGRTAFELLGIERDKAQAMVDAFAVRDRESMNTFARLHKRGVAPYENEDYIAKVKEVGPKMEEELYTEMMAIKEGQAAPSKD